MTRDAAMLIGSRTNRGSASTPEGQQLHERWTRTRPSCWPVIVDLHIVRTYMGHVMKPSLLNCHESDKVSSSGAFVLSANNNHDGCQTLHVIPQLFPDIGVFVHWSDFARIRPTRIVIRAVFSPILRRFRPANGVHGHGAQPPARRSPPLSHPADNARWWLSRPSLPQTIRPL